MPSLLDVNIDDVQSLEAIPADTEVEVRVVRAEQVERKNAPGRYNLAMVLECPEYPMSDDIRVWVQVPGAADKADDPKRFTKMVNRWKGMVAAFGMTDTPERAEDFIGEVATILVGLETSDTYGDQNTVKRWIYNAR